MIDGSGKMNNEQVESICWKVFGIAFLIFIYFIFIGCSFEILLE